MADNLKVKPGVSGDPDVRTKEITAGVHFPISLVGEHVRVYDSPAESITVDGTGEPKTLTVPSGATHASIYCEGAAASTDYVRYWHGTNPSSTVGKKLKDHEEIPSAQPAQFKAAKGSGSGNSTLRVEYYHYA